MPRPVGAAQGPEQGSLRLERGADRQAPQFDDLPWLLLVGPALAVRAADRARSHLLGAARHPALRDAAGGSARALEGEHCLARRHPRLRRRGTGRCRHQDGERRAGGADPRYPAPPRLPRMVARPLSRAGSAALSGSNPQRDGRQGVRHLGQAPQDALPPPRDRRLARGRLRHAAYRPHPACSWSARPTTSARPLPATSTAASSTAITPRPTSHFSSASSTGSITVSRSMRRTTAASRSSGAVLYLTDRW